MRNHIIPHETTDIARSEENAGRNRYRDMVPFDSNIVTLAKMTGEARRQTLTALSHLNNFF